ncbi:hypothetical protein [Desulfovibrio sp. ZJ200]|uniref:hypothetical protein n=1 Tax=Desulfovibrio sp. ZJ200 TaxID=2709792 RepID=UPI0013EB998F|nr:hypothetical protein [Desulfovibrio sp. ZJ200]
MGHSDSTGAAAGWLSIFQKEGSHFSRCFGFSTQEDWGCWSEDNPCGFTVKALASTCAQRLTLLINIYKPDFMTISVNGETLYSHNYKGEHEIRLDLPAGLAENEEFTSQSVLRIPCARLRRKAAPTRAGWASRFAPFPLNLLKR